MEHEVSYKCLNLLCREAICLSRESPGGLVEDIKCVTASWGDGDPRLFLAFSEYTVHSPIAESEPLNPIFGILQVFEALASNPMHHLCGIPILQSASPFKPAR